MRHICRFTIALQLTAGLLIATTQATWSDCQVDGTTTIVCTGTDTDGTTGSAGGDTITVEAGATVSNAGDAIVGNGGSDTVVNNGTVTSTSNQGIVIDAGTVTNNGTITADDDGINVTSGAVINNGTITSADNGITISDGTVTNNGTVVADFWAVNVLGAATVVNNGTLNSSTGANAIEGSGASQTVVNNGVIIAAADNNAMTLGGGDDTVILNGGSVTTGSIDTGSGNDTVTIALSTMTTGVSCGDIPVAAVYETAPVVNGVINGAAGSDTLNFSYVSSDPNAALPGAAQAYTTAGIESVRGSVTQFHGGPTRLYDDGVVLAFTSSNGNGIDVCSGTMGGRVATIDFASLNPPAEGQLFSTGNAGWFVRVFKLSDTYYQVNVYDGSGALVSDKFGFVR